MSVAKIPPGSNTCNACPAGSTADNSATASTAANALLPADPAQDAYPEPTLQSVYEGMLAGRLRLPFWALQDEHATDSEDGVVNQASVSEDQEWRYHL